MPENRCPECGEKLKKHEDQHLKNLVSQCTNPNCGKFFLDKSIFDVV